MHQCFKILLNLSNEISAKFMKSNSTSYYDLESVGQSVLVSVTHMGPVINFSFSLKFYLDSCGFVILQRSL
jgi:hypothetical protein